MLDAIELVALSCVHRNGDGLASGNLLEVIRSETLLLVVDEDSLERQSLAVCLFVRVVIQRLKLSLRTGISYQQVLGSMVTEDRVTLEDLNGIASGVGDRYIDSVRFSLGDRDGQRASSRRSASKKSDRKSLGEHDEELDWKALTWNQMRVRFVVIKTTLSVSSYTSMTVLSHPSYSHPVH